MTTNLKSKPIVHGSRKTSADTAFPPVGRYEALPRRGLLAAAGFDLKTARRAAPDPLFNHRPLLSNLVSLAASENKFLAGPVLGAPMAVMVLEELIRRGAEEIIFVGLAGGLARAEADQPGPDWSFGDLLLPTGGCSTEGTSAHYPAPLKPDAALAQKIQAAAENKIKAEEIWSTDAIYRETAELTAAQWDQGARSVDMECTALWAAAAFRGVRLASLLVISDILTLRGNPATMVEHRTGFQRPDFKQGLTRAAETAWKALIL